MEENNDIRQTLSDPEKVSWLAACGWTEEDIAKSLGMSHRAFMSRVEDPADELFDSVVRGRLQKRAEVEINIARFAAAGDTDSIKQFSEIVRSPFPSWICSVARKKRVPSSGFRTILRPAPKGR